MVWVGKPEMSSLLSPGIDKPLAGKRRIVKVEHPLECFPTFGVINIEDNDPTFSAALCTDVGMWVLAPPLSNRFRIVRGILNSVWNK
jgi:hypothetical protein